MFLEWIYGIIGISVLGILLDIILPDGETNKYVKGIFGLVTVLVIISPLTKIVGQKLDFDKVFGINSQIEVDEDYMKYFYSEQYLQTENKLENCVKQKYGTEVDVKIRFVESCPQNVDVLYLYCKNVVIDGQGVNKHIIEEIEEYVRSTLNLKGEQIIIRYV